MRVPGEIADKQRGLRRRPIAATVTLLATLLIAYLYMPIPLPRVAAATAGDCVELHLYSNGYHSDIGAPASIFPADHPLRRMYPEAREFLIGWGDEVFYRSDGSNLWLGVDALIPPSASVLHVTYDAPEASRYLGPNDDLAIGVSAEGAARFVAVCGSCAGAGCSGRADPRGGRQGGGSLSVPALARFVPFVQRLQSVDGACAPRRGRGRECAGGMAGRPADPPSAAEGADVVCCASPGC